MKYVLWILQVLLALMFLFGGVTKFFPTPEAIAATNQLHLSILFLKFVGVCEILGALGLILPGLTGIKPWLTPLAAIGLAIIMVGAIAVTFPVGGISMAVAPLVTGLVCVFVAYGRWKLVPLGSR